MSFRNRLSCGTQDRRKLGWGRCGDRRQSRASARCIPKTRKSAIAASQHPASRAPARCTLPAVGDRTAQAHNLRTAIHQGPPGSERLCELEGRGGWFDRL